MAWFRRTPDPEPHPVAAYVGDGRPDQYHPHSLYGMRVSSDAQKHLDMSSFESSAVYRGAQILADLISQLPWYAYTGGDPSLTGQRLVEPPRRLTDQPSLLLKPDLLHDRDEVLRQIVMSLVFHGNAFLYAGLLDSETLRPVQVQVVDPVEVATSWNERRTGPRYTWRGTEMRRDKDFWHIAVNRPAGSLLGIGPLYAGANIVAGIRAADDFARRLFTDSGVPPAVLETDSKLKPDEARDIQKLWDEQHAGARGTAVLSGGLKFREISLTPEQAQFLATRAYGAQEVARLLGIPQWFLNAGSPPGTASALTYQNLNQVFVELARTTLGPTYLRRIESLFSSLLPRGQMVKFDLSEFLATDTESRYAAYQTALETGVLTLNEVRAMEGLPPTTTQTQPAEVPADE